MKLKRISALFLSITMFLQVMPMLNVFASSSTNVNVNYTFDTADELNEITFSNTNKEVVTEADGNKALKITGANQITFTTPVDTATKYVEVSYKLKVESYAQNTQLISFGSVRKDTTDAIYSINYSSGCNIFSGTYNARMIDFGSCTEYKTIKYILNTSTKTYEAYVDGVLFEAWPGGTRDFRDSSLESINNLYFNNQSGNVVYLDDVIIKEVADVPVDLSNDFSSENCLDGITFSGTNKEVVTEADGNKALKIAGANQVTFNTPTDTISKYVEISFKLKAESYAQNTQILSFGSVRNGTTEAVRAINYNGGFNVYSGTSNMKILNIGDCTDYKAIKYILNTETKTYEAYVDGVLCTSHPGGTRSFYDATVSSINNLYFNNQADNIIYLDDIVIRDITFGPVTVDFDSYNTGALTDLMWSVATPANSSITVENDPTAENPQNKAIKLVVGDSSTATRLGLNFGEMKDKKIRFSYDLKVENHSRSALDGGFGVVASGSTPIVKTITYRNSMNCYFGSSNVGVYNMKNFDNYKHVEYLLDMENDTYNVWIDGVRKAKYNGTEFGFSTASDSVDNLFFSMRYRADDPSGCTASDYGIYWIDNISIQPADLDVVSGFPYNGSEDAPLDRKISVILSDSIDESTLSYDTVKVYANSTQLGNNEYKFEKTSDNTVVIKLTEKMKENTTYKVLFTSGVNENSSYLTSDDGVVYSFKTIENFDEFDPFKKHILDIDNKELPEFTQHFNFTIPNTIDGTLIESEAVDSQTALYTEKVWTNSDGVTFEFMKIKSEPVYYNDEYHDDTEVAAYIAYPENATSLDDKLPALLVLHGSGQTAQSAEFYNIVNNWAKAGYVVMATDLPGMAGLPESDTVTSGAVLNITASERDPARFRTAPDITASTTYVSEATALKAFNLLYNSRITDINRVGITGISMGGYSTTLLTGMLGDKVNSAFSVYGCGFYENGTTFNVYLNPENTTSSNYGNPDEINRWLNAFDAGRRADGVKANFFFGAAANDIFYYPSSVMETYDAMTAANSKNIYFAPNQSHASSQVGGSTDTTRRSIWKSEDHYFDYYLKGEGSPITMVNFTSVTDKNADNIYVEATVVRGVDVNTSKPVVYYSASEGIEWKNRQWQALDEANITLSVNEAKEAKYIVCIPRSMLSGNDFYVAVADNTNNMSVASKIIAGEKMENNIYSTSVDVSGATINVALSESSAKVFAAVYDGTMLSSVEVFNAINGRQTFIAKQEPDAVFVWAENNKSLCTAWRKTE